MDDNGKLKVYLDTSVVSYLKQDDAPEKTGIALKHYWKWRCNYEIPRWNI